MSKATEQYPGQWAREILLGEVTPPVPEHKPVIYTQHVSTELLECIRYNECESEVGSLATARFRALWNEIERLRALLLRQTREEG